MKYVGFTTTKLNKRLAGHRANILNGTEGYVMLMHFTKHHNISDMIIKPIEICDRSVLRKKEQFWIQELNTAFSYGLNSKLKIKYIIMLTFQIRHPNLVVVNVHEIINQKNK